MPTWGPVYPTTARQENNPAAFGPWHAVNWGNLPGAPLRPDDWWSETWQRGADAQTHWLVLEGFDFSGLPQDVRVRGILVEIRARTRNDTHPYPQIRRVRIRLGGSPAGQEREGPWLDRASGAQWSWRWFSLGGDGDLWGAPTITRSDLNGFGVQLWGFLSGWRTSFTSIGCTLDIDSVRVTIYYDPIDPRENQGYTERVAVYEYHTVEDMAVAPPGMLTTEPFWRHGRAVWWLAYSGDMRFWRLGIPEVQMPEFMVTVLEAPTEDGASLIAGEADQLPLPDEEEPPSGVDVDQGEDTVPGTGDRPGGSYWRKQRIRTGWEKL